MRAAQFVLGTIAILIVLSLVLVYIRHRSFEGFNPYVEIVLGTVLGLYAYKKDVNQKREQKQGND
ncbi:MAG: hypothetical protein ACJA1A_003512 [Saprospiraceae bacterium]|jgi:hypothetical protein|tara:strand:- start:818 stop:1012 length:195 start_codon:yes stop_codon:yes gene_type:complete